MLIMSAQTIGRPRSVTSSSLLSLLAGHEERCRRRTKVDNVKHFRSILSNSRKHRTVRTRTDCRDDLEMGPVVLDKLYALGLLLPELEVAVERSGEDEVRSVRGATDNTRLIESGQYLFPHRADNGQTSM